MRAFIAIEIPPSIKKAALKIQDELKKFFPLVSWTEKNNLHITLKFLGEINEETARKILPLLEEESGKINVFKIKFDSLGVFPGFNQPRIIWLGSGIACQELTSLASSLEKSLEVLGIQKENRQFKAHITIGRIKSNQDFGKIREVFKITATEIGKKQLEFTAEGLTLFKSNLSSAKPSYTPLAFARFRII